MAAIEIARLENESQFDFHKRLVYGKLVDKTLADADYSELSELVYGQAYSSDVARRMLYGSRRTLELMDQEKISVEPSDDNVAERLREIDLKTYEIRKESQKLFDQRREYSKLAIQDGRQEHLNECLIRAAENLSDTIGVISDSTYVPSLKFSNNEAVLVLSDWHYGMTTSNIFNTYNKEICIERIKSLVDKTKERLLLNECIGLHIVVLGDLYHGAIHTSARVASEELVCEQLMQVSEILAQVILDLSKFVEFTNVYMTYGNHCRTVQNKHDSIHRDNMERIIPWWLKQRIGSEEGKLGIEPGSLGINIIEESAYEFITMNVCGYDMVAAHGDLDTVSGSLKTLPALFLKQYGKSIDYILLGDKHHKEYKDEIGITAEICGSLCGTDDYANSKRLYSTPTQLLLIMNEAEGIDAAYRIKCN